MEQRERNRVENSFFVPREPGPWYTEARLDLKGVVRMALKDIPVEVRRFMIQFPRMRQGEIQNLRVSGMSETQRNA